MFCSPSYHDGPNIMRMKKEDLRIVFMGTPEFAVETLRQLVENQYHVVAVVTQPDKPVGRHQSEMQPSQVKQYALSVGLPVLQPEKMKDEVFVEQLRSYGADVFVVVAFRMLPEVVWAMPRFGTFNVHAALLPQYRGAAPINWAVINGERQTGVTTFFLDHDIDTGRVIMQMPFTIEDDYNVEQVYDGLMHLGADIAMKTLDLLIENDGQVKTLPQEEMIPTGALLHEAPKLFKDNCRINWYQTSKQIYDFVRGLSPYPGAWTVIVSPEKKETVLKIFKTVRTNRMATDGVGTIVVDRGHLFLNTSDQLLELLELQMSGKKRMSARDFLNGFHDIESFSCL